MEQLNMKNLKKSKNVNVVHWLIQDVATETVFLIQSIVITAALEVLEQR